ncbi:carnitine 3-dehydrogenase [Roseovarius gahaiensis]|uniref:L-carnitine dehydrogenase n=1 Tax=Roseovarius gahaiensis TaxID=2716691 RepID=A0A967EG31_9RHOB|nr:carnitine 3-dehydrogenase [Roseovarius gahaiensis]NHQ76038.1 carnitine 3-dehydrogenase [Roseovarius gahaiensis]
MTKTAAIIGGGVIGGGWAARFLLNGWNVRVFDPDPSAEARLAAVLDNARHALPMLYDFALPDEGTLSLHSSIADAVNGADWVQESVSERLDLKHQVIAEVQAANPDALVGSSTSGFTPSQLQQGAADPSRIMVTHPFNPVYLLPLVELVPSPVTDPASVDRCKTWLTALGMYPLHVSKEIDAHIADRLLEAVWREALWLVNDDIATTEEIDNAIRYAFGLRWGQMGLFETYRIAGGEAGMRHFLGQFGPALKWPWTKLMDVPDLTDALIDKIAHQSDAQSGHLSIRELERTRDANLIAMMRALRQQDAASGALVNAHQQTIRQPLPDQVPLVSKNRVIPSDWTDVNGHMNEGRYGQIFSDAADAVLDHIGAGEDYIASGLSYFTVETGTKYLAESYAGERVQVQTRVTEGQGKKLRCVHRMIRAADGAVLATCDQLLIHVNLETRRSCEPDPGVADRLARLAARHASDGSLAE